MCLLRARSIAHHFRCRHSHANSFGNPKPNNHFSFPAIFASTLIHIIQIRKGDTHISVLYEHRVRLAMHILEKFQDAWPHVLSTCHLLDCLLNSSSPQSSGEAEHNLNSLQSEERSEAVEAFTGRSQDKSTHIQHVDTPVEDQLCQDSVDRQDQLAYDSLSTSMMPIFPFNIIADDSEFNLDSWAIDQNGEGYL